MSTAITVVGLVLGAIGTAGTLASALWGRQRDRDAGSRDERRLTLEEWRALTAELREQKDDLERQLDRERADHEAQLTAAQTSEAAMREQRDALWVAMIRKEHQ